MSTPSLYDILSKKLEQKRKDHPSFRLLDIDENLFPNGIIRFETKAKDSDNKLKTVKDIVAESWKKEEKNHLMIQGEGGIGKTVTLLSLPDRFTPFPVPAIYIPLHEIKGDFSTIEKYIKKRVLDNNEDLYGQLLNLYLIKPWNNGPNLLLLLDGFNEIFNEYRETISEDIEQWSEYPGIQVITSSRFDIHQYVALRSSFSKIELQPLSEDTVLEYLKSNNFDTPRSSAITKLITIPLLLTLYIKTETIRREQPAPFAKFLETKNAGTLIWNYLQCELWRFRNNREEAKASVLAMEFIAPYIAWTMQQQSKFSLEESVFLDEIDKAYSLMGTHYANKDKFPQHIKTTLQKSIGLPDYDHIRSLLEEQLCLFINNDGHYKLMHQQFRDALAAMHLINSIYLSGNSRPTEWNPIVDHYVMQFVANLIGEDEANRLWEQNRTSPQLESATRNQLELQRQLHNCDFSKLDFSGLDLSNISLYPFQINKATIKLPIQSERMNETKLSRKTFSAEGHDGAVIAIAVTPDGKRIISGSNDKSIRIWDLETGTPIGNQFEGHKGSVNSITITPDGKRIVSGSNDKSIRIWDLETGTPIGNPFEGNEGSINAIAVTPEGKCIISGSGDKTIRIWDLETGKLKKDPIVAHNGQVYAIAVTPDGKHIISGSKDKTIRIWDLETGRLKGNPIDGHEGSVNAIAVSPDGKRIISGSDDKTIRIWDLKTCTPIGNPIEGHEGSVNAIAISPDGKRIVSGSNDKTIRIWDIETRTLIGNPIIGHKGRVNTITITPNGKQIISGTSNGTIRIWNLADGKQIGNPIEKTYKDSVYAIAITPDSKHIVSGTNNKTIRILELKNGTTTKEPFKGHNYAVTSVAVTPDGTRIVSGSWDKTIRIWSFETGNPIGNPIEGHKNLINTIVVTSDNKRIVSGSDDRTICIWNLETGTLIRNPIKGHEGRINAIALTTDGKRIVSGSDDKTIRIWDLESGNPIGKPIEGHDDWVLAVAITSDGKHIVSGSKDKTIRIWNLENGNPIGNPIKGNIDWVNAVTVTPDNKQIISGSGDGTVRIWELETGKLKRVWQEHKDRVRAIALTPNGKYIVSGADNGTICITDTESYETKTIRILPLSLFGLDFSKAEISDAELKETLRQNGAIV